MLPDYRETNRLNWNDRARLHSRSADYDIAGFARRYREEAPSLAHRYEELGEVAGRSLLHLQCHLGTETIEFQRRGASAVGVDLSDASIAIARSLADDVGSEARFVTSSVEDLPDVLEERFDIVFASYGILCWVEDLARWTGVAAHFLKPGGTFYLIDGHPLVMALRDEAPELDPQRSYFFHPEPMRFEFHGSYVSETEPFEHPVSYQWPHHLGEIVTSLVATGLEIEFLHEFPHAAYRALPQMTEGVDGYWRLPEERVPFLFSIRARKAATLPSGRDFGA